MQEPSPRPTVLVVDDQPINVQLLQRVLERHRLQVLVAYRGEEALKMAADKQPDLILLDIMMPEMDGLEVCRRLKATDGLRDIPVIFITARGAKENKLEGLGTGAADYLVKPIDVDETIARVNTQLRIRESFRQNLELSQRLSEARRHATVAHISEGIAHNLNNLLGIVTGYLDLLKNAQGDPARFTRSVEKMESAVGRMTKIVSDLTTVAQFNQPRRELARARQVLEHAVERYHEEEHADVPVEISGEGLDELLITNNELLEMVLGRLMANAWESYPEKLPNPERPIRLETRLTSEGDQPVLEIAVVDRGLGVEEAVREHVFEAFVSTRSAVGRGMGLTIARHSLRSLGGEVRLAPNPGGGTRALLLHPLPKPAELEALRSS